jgi:hypothetical protein
VAGVFCDYDEGRCGCAPCRDPATGQTNSDWSCLAWDAGAAPGCPARAPLLGSACDIPDLLCFYGGCTTIPIGNDMQCTDGFWRVTSRAGTCAISACPSM